MTPRIAGIGTARPPYGATQAEVRSVVEDLFGDALASDAALLAVFDHDHIRERAFIRPLSWYRQHRRWPEQNAAWHEAALDLGEQAIRAALDDAGLVAADVDALVVASTTGFATPSLDSTLQQRLGMPASTIRLPIVGLGCAGGVAGLARAGELCAARGGRTTVFLAVEVCSATFQPGDTSRSNIVGTSLFADGAASVVLHRDGRGPAILHGCSTLFPDTADVMGWDVTEGGLKVRFRRDIPAIVRRHLADVVSTACTSWGIDRDAIGHVVTHPGGAKVLDAITEALELDVHQLRHARDVLRDCGNMSSPTVLFVLERHWCDTAGLAGTTLVSALGPGFSAEQLLLVSP